MLEYYVNGSPPPRGGSGSRLVRYCFIPFLHPFFVPFIELAYFEKFKLTRAPTLVSLRRPLDLAFTLPRNQALIHVNPENRAPVHRRVYFLRIIRGFPDLPIVRVTILFLSQFRYTTPSLLHHRHRRLPVIITLSYEPLRFTIFYDFVDFIKKLKRTVKFHIFVCR